MKPTQANRSKFFSLKSFVFLMVAATMLIPQSCSTGRENESIGVVSKSVKGSFPLVMNKEAASIYIDPTDAEVVKIAAEAFSGDIELITSTKPRVISNNESLSDYPIIVGTLGQSVFIDKLATKGIIPAEKLKGKWETFVIAVVDKPFDGVKKALVIAGSDRRGTAFGVFEFSKMMGVSPLVWWADVLPEKRESLFVTRGELIAGPPSVKYRGIFLNDEDWGLQPWAAKHFDTDIKDIGPKTYAHIFELLLRLKANYIWPAMHSCTKAFYYYPENPKVADRYAILVGSSHCEPILRDNPFEWTMNFKNEYGKEPGEWNYATNKAQIYKYWDDRAVQSANYESVYTIGMRNIHDSAMPGAKTPEGKIKILNEVIADQRSMLEKRIGKPVSEIPQIFCPYKEVLKLYRLGINLPDDVTIVWSDDNHGYIRQLSNNQEQKHSGRGGVYYHISYWGQPGDYLWLSSMSPSLVAFEMHKAFQFGADRLWVFNVGDIKPAEMELEFAMDMAWNIDRWTPVNATTYTENWAARTFGKPFAKPISEIKSDYYRLAQKGKPEHLGVLEFSDEEMEQRLNDYQKILEKAEALSSKIPANLKDAYFELILYPVKGAALMNQKHFYARKSLALAKNGDEKAVEYAGKSTTAFQQIQQETEKYNTGIAGGKWSGMISCNPRNLTVFKMPQVATTEMVKNFSEEMILPDSNSFVNGRHDGDLIEKRVSASTVTPSTIVIQAANFTTKKEVNGEKIVVLPGLGLNGNSVAVYPFSTTSTPDSLASSASYLEYKVKISAGLHNVRVKTLPAHSIHNEWGMRYGISINNSPIQIVDLNAEEKSTVWNENVLRGYSLGTTSHQIETSGKATIRIYLFDPGLVVSRVEVQ